MTKKDFELIASVIDRTRAATTEDGPNARVAVRLAADIFASELADANPRFDRERFLQACGF